MPETDSGLIGESDLTDYIKNVKLACRNDTHDLWDGRAELAQRLDDVVVEIRSHDRPAEPTHHESGQMPVARVNALWGLDHLGEELTTELSWAEQIFHRQREVLGEPFGLRYEPRLLLQEGYPVARFRVAELFVDAKDLSGISSTCDVLGCLPSHWNAGAEGIPSPEKKYGAGIAAGTEQVGQCLDRVLHNSPTSQRAILIRGIIPIRAGSFQKRCPNGMTKASTD
jgi:hypothetical protein